MRDYVRRAALARGIDPNVAVAVGNSEALRVFDPNRPDHGGDKGNSFGPFQLHYAGTAPGTRLPGLGEVFTRKTGLSARGSRTWRQQIDFALDWARTHGWGDWHGAANTGIGRWQGIGTFKPVPINGGIPVAALPSLREAARRHLHEVKSGASAAASIHNKQSSIDNRRTSQSEVKIASININAPSGDPHTIAKSIGPAIERHSFATHANYGMA